jgi:hypothetical protein
MAEIKPRTYRKTATVQAMQWDGTAESTLALLRWADGKITQHADGWHLTVHTLEGPLNMEEGDWALMGDEGEFWPNRGDIFARSYEIADSRITLLHPDSPGSVRVEPCLMRRLGLLRSPFATPGEVRKMRQGNR